ncbi:hypothetical protein EIP91_008279 [Steccherinum ochraceum]|uniref:Uncharacterized protein n=1 Tax=Steccherinum ochraceum TaxID=92696 RepID=A0A4R0R8R8_9APHY|nr:hypothetical protein EIP91_008279 [Steccherinum ochraceum]
MVQFETAKVQTGRPCGPRKMNCTKASKENIPVNSANRQSGIVGVPLVIGKANHLSNDGSHAHQDIIRVPRGGQAAMLLYMRPDASLKGPLGGHTWRAGLKVPTREAEKEVSTWEAKWKAPAQGCRVQRGHVNAVQSTQDRVRREEAKVEAAGTEWEHRMVSLACSSWYKGTYISVKVHSPRVVRPVEIDIAKIEEVANDMVLLDMEEGQKH